MPQGRLGEVYDRDTTEAKVKVKAAEEVFQWLRQLIGTKK